jgi:hypothetical protein
MCGVRTNVVTAVEIRDRYAADTKSLPYLVDMTAENFVVRPHIERVMDRQQSAVALPFDEVVVHGALGGKSLGSWHHWQPVVSTWRIAFRISHRLLLRSGGRCGSISTHSSSVTSLG